MIEFIIQVVVLSGVIVFAGYLLSLVARKVSQKITLVFISNFLDEIDSDIFRGFNTLALVFAISSVAAEFSPLEASFVVKNLLSGAVIIVCSMLITFGTLTKESLMEHYEQRVNLSDKDKSITLTLIPIVGSILRYLNISTTAVTILWIWGVDIAPVLSGTAIALAVFGFAGQSILQDLLGFLSLIIDRPYYVGSEVEFRIMDSYSERGVIKEITLRNTVLKIQDSYLFYVPNRDAKNFRVWRK